MKKNNMGYKIGLAVLGIFVIGLAIFVIKQANDTKQDAVTDKAANKIAEKLNNFVNTNNKIPDSLSRVGAGSIPPTIMYTKLSNSRYKFCVNFKTTSSGFNASDSVINTATGNTVDTTPPEYSNKGSLIISATHYKGANCQMITPYLAPDVTSNICAGTNASLPGNGNCYDFMCGSSYADTWSAIKVIKIRAANSEQDAAITISSLPDAKTFDIGPNVKFFDAKCTPISLSDFQPGDSITLYFSTTGESNVAMITKD